MRARVHPPDIFPFMLARIYQSAHLSKQLTVIHQLAKEPFTVPLTRHTPTNSSPAHLDCCLGRQTPFKYKCLSNAFFTCTLGILVFITKAVRTKMAAIRNTLSKASRPQLVSFTAAVLLLRPHRLAYFQST